MVVRGGRALASSSSSDPVAGANQTLRGTTEPATLLPCHAANGRVRVAAGSRLPGGADREEDPAIRGQQAHYQYQAAGCC